MEITQVYALAVVSIFTFFLISNLRSFLDSYVTQLFIYPRIIRRYRYFGPWSPAGVILQLAYAAMNLFCASFKAPNILVVSSRAANLSLINMIPIFAGAHQSFLADVLGVSLNTYQRVHRSTGTIAFLLLVFHIASVVAKRTHFPLQVAENVWAVIVRFSSVV
jgi:hypothetical protein